MPRIACLHVRDLPLAALRRAEPDLRGRPLVTVDRDDPRAPLTAVSSEARALGIRVGLSAAEARTIAAALVDPPEDLVVTLERWGIRTLGQLAALPVTGGGWRFGDVGIRLWRSARGEDDGPLAVRSRPQRFEESTDCGYSIDSFEPLSFL